MTVFLRRFNASWSRILESKYFTDYLHRKVGNQCNSESTNKTEINKVLLIQPPGVGYYLLFRANEQRKYLL